MGIFSAPNIVQDGLILAYDAANVRSFRGVPTVNYLSNPTQTFNSSEFQQYYDLRAIFETNGLVPYSLSFDMRADKPGDVYWYMQNGSYTKYAFVGHNRSATTQWQRFTIENVTPSGPTAAWQANTPSDNRAMLATYTGYGSGVYPQVRNMQLELGTVATPFVNGTRGTTNATGGGWVDLSGNGKHGELINGPTYSSANGGSIVFDGTNDYIELNTNNIITGTNPFTFECWYTITAINGGGEIFGNYGSGYSTNHIWISGEYGIYIAGAVYFPGYPLGAGTYHMVATRAANGATILYKNGQQVNSGTLTASIPVAANFRIGADTNSSGGVGGERLNGKIYQQRVYDRVLTAAEVTQNFEATRARFGV